MSEKSASSSASSSSAVTSLASPATLDNSVEIGKAVAPAAGVALSDISLSDDGSRSPNASPAAAPPSASFNGYTLRPPGTRRSNSLSEAGMASLGRPPSSLGSILSNSGEVGPLGAGGAGLATGAGATTTTGAKTTAGAGFTRCVRAAFRSSTTYCLAATSPAHFSTNLMKLEMLRAKSSSSSEVIIGSVPRATRMSLALTSLSFLATARASSPSAISICPSRAATSSAKARALALASAAANLAASILACSPLIWAQTPSICCFSYACLTTSPIMRAAFSCWTRVLRVLLSSRSAFSADSSVGDLTTESLAISSLAAALATAVSAR